MRHPGDKAAYGAPRMFGIRALKASLLKNTLCSSLGPSAHGRHRRLIVNPRILGCIKKTGAIMSKAPPAPSHLSRVAALPRKVCGQTSNPLPSAHRQSHTQTL
jgi:hypothetical protein